MANPTLKQFRYFAALSRYRHFGRAADACAISQPALSMQVKELEQTLGTALLERGGRDVRLTPFGEVVASRAAAILQSVEEIEDLARASHATLSGRLRIGVIPTIAPYLLPRLIGDLGRDYPGLDIQIRETQTQTLMDELTAGQIDTAILALPVSAPAFTEVALFDEAFVLVRPAADADKPVPNRAMLREMRLLLLEEGHCFREQALSFCNAPSVREWGGMDGSSLSTLVQMVGAGMGVTLLPEMAINVESRSAPVAIGTFPDPQPTRTIGMIWRKTNPLADQLAEVARVVKDAGQALRPRT
ncbi:LysR substrate-binding domain-containing protein [Yoonia sp. 208BN28-4]|uniref:LysR substrate-binding domain-containing protein n=1 Tax=Yoonia sp. 208BN28-4 TaxID=3126505 RepID=UPI0030AEF008